MRQMSARESAATDWHPCRTPLHPQGDQGGQKHPQGSRPGKSAAVPGGLGFRSPGIASSHPFSRPEDFPFCPK